MIRSTLALALAFALSLTGQGEASASGARLDIGKTDTHARVIKVGVRDGRLLVGNDVTNAVYTWGAGDPPCDPSGTTVYFGHAWRAGPGTADRWGALRKGNVIRVGGCRFRVSKRVYWPGSRRITSLFRVDGPPRIVLFGCKADDYSKRILVFASLVR